MPRLRGRESSGGPGKWLREEDEELVEKLFGGARSVQRRVVASVQDWGYSNSFQAQLACVAALYSVVCVQNAACLSHAEAHGTLLLLLIVLQQSFQRAYGLGLVLQWGPLTGNMHGKWLAWVAFSTVNAVLLSAFVTREKGRVFAVIWAAYLVQVAILRFMTSAWPIEDSELNALKADLLLRQRENSLKQENMWYLAMVPALIGLAPAGSPVRSPLAMSLIAPGLVSGWTLVPVMLDLMPFAVAMERPPRDFMRTALLVVGLGLGFSAVMSVYVVRSIPSMLAESGNSPAFVAVLWWNMISLTVRLLVIAVVSAALATVFVYMDVEELASLMTAETWAQLRPENGEYRSGT